MVTSYLFQDMLIVMWQHMFVSKQASHVILKITFLHPQLDGILCVPEVPESL